MECSGRSSLGGVCTLHALSLLPLRPSLHTAGYRYAFPFLEPASDGAGSATGSGGGSPSAPAPPPPPPPPVLVQDNCVSPLYRHVFPPALAPTLGFVGLCWKVVPFPQFELQAAWVAAVLAGRARLPPRGDMEREVAEAAAELASRGLPMRYAHCQAGGVQWAYNRWLIEQIQQGGCAGSDGGDNNLPPPTDCTVGLLGSPWRQELYVAAGASRSANAGRYRDVPLEAQPAAGAALAAARQEAEHVRRRMRSGFV